MTKIPHYLLGDGGCEKHEPCTKKCVYAVRQRQDTGRWYITMGHPGFNLPANNASGYQSPSAARWAIQRHGGWLATPNGEAEHPVQVRAHHRGLQSPRTSGLSPKDQILHIIAQDLRRLDISFEPEGYEQVRKEISRFYNSIIDRALDAALAAEKDEAAPALAAREEAK